MDRSANDKSGFPQSEEIGTIAQLRIGGMSGGASVASIAVTADSVVATSFPLHNVFVYGTLLSDEVVNVLLQRVPRCSLAVLDGYHRFRIKGRVYPAILPIESKKVTGRVIMGITDAEMNVLDSFEDEEYERKTIEVSLDGDSGKLLAETYVWRDKNDPALYGDWDFQEWEELHKNEFLKMTQGFLEEMKLPESKTRMATYESHYKMDNESSCSSKSSKITKNKSSDGAEFHADVSSEQCSGTCSNSLAFYNPNYNNPREQLNRDSKQTLTSAIPNASPRTSSSIGSFTVQCATCFKWRLIPTKEKYEQIRENILQMPFVCQIARDWRPDVSCDDPADICQDGSRIWAIDKPNIAQPPFGWRRELRIRGEGSTKFADVYYVAPSGKRFRSLIEVQKYLEEHPEYSTQGISLSQFSFQTPRPLQQNYVKKKGSRMQHPIAATGSALMAPPDLDEGLQTCKMEIGVPESIPTAAFLPYHSSSPTKKRAAKEVVRRPPSKKYDSNGDLMPKTEEMSFEDAQPAGDPHGEM
ncbi:hypothetical protein HPP92_010596 [Vanilla planifolia]|uniref:Putative gamma-glutamylcyclotransferase n=1 Tax=Vanilla planifolia TaxID=51239 RepID=A0A835V1Z5_VANPL|nr:hypothetical protein HPP92_010596 [Vanilla planifolia]